MSKARKLEAVRKATDMREQLLSLLAHVPTLKALAEKAWANKVQAPLEKNRVAQALRAAQRLYEDFQQALRITAERLFERVGEEMLTMSNRLFLEEMEPNWLKIQQTKESGNYSLLIAQCNWALSVIQTFRKQFNCVA